MLQVNEGRSGALMGIHVVDLTEGVAGPYCSLLLAGLGAHVVKVEPLAGDRTRSWPPFVGDRPGPERSLHFLHLNRAKRSTVLDRAQTGDRATFAALVEQADAVIADGAVERALADWGVDAGSLLAAHPTIVLASLTETGSASERKDWVGGELITAALSGLASCTGDPGRPPVKPGGHICSIAHGQTAAAAVLAALLTVGRGGAGSTVTVDAVEASADLLEMWACGAYQQIPMPRQGRHHNSNFPFEVYPARDGLVGVHAGPGAWSDFASLIGRPDLDTPAFVDLTARIAARELIERAILDWLAHTDTIDAYHAGQARRFAFGYVATTADLLASPQLAARDFFRALDHPEAGRLPYPGEPFRMASGWWHERAPLLGEHTHDIERAAAEYRRTADPRTDAPADANHDPRYPLAGLRVLDLTQIWAGPRATKVFTDFGAEVIKVESPSRLDGTRGYPRYLADLAAGRIVSESQHNGRSAFEQLHRGERSITLDLQSPDGARAFGELVAQSDVVIANFAAGVIERLSIAWPDLEVINPRVILMSMTGFGDSGPQRGYVGYGVTQEELCGLYSITGYQDGEPLKSGSNVGDPMNGMHAVVAVLAALVERERTGRGQYIELSQLESAVGFIGEFLLDQSANARTSGPTGNAHPCWAPQGIFPARGEDAWIAIAVETDAQWTTLTAVLGAADLAESMPLRYLVGRRAAGPELDRQIGEYTISLDRFELAAELQARGVPAAPVQDSIEVLHEPSLEESGFVQNRPHPSGHPYRYFGPLWRVNGERPALRAPAPLLAEHQLEVLSRLTSLGRAAIEGQAPSRAALTQPPTSL